MSLADAIEQPIVIGELVFPKLTLRNFGLLAAKYQATQVKKLKDLLASEKASPEAKFRVLSVNATSDYTIDDVHNWAVTIEGSINIARQSLVQGGMVEADAGAAIEKLGAGELRDVAMEVTDHPRSPRREAKAQAEWEEKTAAEKRKAEEDAKNPPKSGG